MSPWDVHCTSRALHFTQGLMQSNTKTIVDENSMPAMQSNIQGGGQGVWERIIDQKLWQDSPREFRVHGLAGPQKYVE